MTIEQAIQFISEQKFTFAQSYAKTLPHTYLQRRKCTDEILFEQFIQVIREKGAVYTFFQKQYIYLEIDEYVYWEMGRPIKCVQVLNRADKNSLHLNGQKLAPEHQASELKNKLAERERYLDNLLNKSQKTDRDIRQIEFLMNTERRIHGGGKNIIDNYQMDIRYE